MEKRTYQIAASAKGWRDAQPMIIHNLTHPEAVAMGYGMALLFQNEVRIADVTNYDNMNKRNSERDLMGNGCYLHYMNAKSYFENN